MREKTFKLSGQFISSYPIRKWKQNWLSIGRRWKIEETGYSQKISQFMQKLQSGYRNSPVNSKQKGGRAKHLKGSLEEKKPQTNEKGRTLVFPMGISTQWQTFTEEELCQQVLSAQSSIPWTNLQEKLRFRGIRKRNVC